MQLMPTRCPKCGDQMSTPMAGKRTGLLMSTCRNGECLYTERSATPQITESFKPSTPTHGSMFTPDTSRPAPPRPRAGAMQRLEKAWMQGTFDRELRKSRQTAAAGNAIDPKLKQLGDTDR